MENELKDIQVKKENVKLLKALDNYTWYFKSYTELINMYDEKLKIISIKIYVDYDFG